MIKIKDLQKSFDDHDVLKGISLEVGKGEVFALVGGSGGGKSVLLKHVAGLMKPDRGTVTCGRHGNRRCRTRILAGLSRTIGFSFSGGGAF